jgi:hypothetical protein
MFNMPVPKFPSVGNVLICKSRLYTGVNDFTKEAPLAEGSLGIVLYTDEYQFTGNEALLLPSYNEPIILTILFDRGILNWGARWGLWYTWLRLIE